jgi:microcystin-dependent protein
VGLEVATYISQLVATNPVVTDQETQGANHLQLIKGVLLNTFPNASQPNPFPTATAVSANTSILAAQQNSTIFVNTSGGAVTLTLPTLLSSQAGWEVSIIKATTDTNPVFIAPATGTMNSGDLAGLSQCRRCIPGARTRVLWGGSVWYAERVPRVPVGTVLDFQGSVLPVGYEWPDGQMLSSSANYPEYYAINGNSLVTPDLRGRVAAGVDNMGGSAANRITSGGSGIVGTTLNASGGAEVETLTQNNLPSVSYPYTGGASGVMTWGGNTTNFFGAASGTPFSMPSINNISRVTIGGTIGPLGIATPVVTTQPSIMMNKILVTE